VAAKFGPHLQQLLPAIRAPLVLSLPLARLAQRVAPLRVFIVSGSSLMYAIPSLALFVILPLILGTGIRDVANVVVALTLYGMALLVPATVEALEAVDDRVRDAATAVGMGAARRASPPRARSATSPRRHPPSRATACKSSSRKNAHKKAKLRIICRPCAKSCWKSCPNTSTYHWTTSASPKRNKMAWTFLS